MPKRAVLHVFRYFRPDFTGEGIYLEKLAPLLAARGIRSDVIAASTRPPAVAPELPGTDRLRYFGRPGAGGAACGPAIAALAAASRAAL